VKHLLESHGTELAVKSDPGKGSEFSFFLRLAEEVSG
jgi:signal transduction histidine kinase